VHNAKAVRLNDDAFRRPEFDERLAFSVVLATPRRPTPVRERKPESALAIWTLGCSSPQ
jgi:hypothetical protein